MVDDYIRCHYSATSLLFPSIMASSTIDTISCAFGNKFVEFLIGAFTILIGSSLAETLVLGDRGSAGLVWGTIGTFGAGSIIKACINGASPGWLRVLLGLRDRASDEAIGLDLELARDSRSAIRARSTFDAPLGISCDSKVGIMLVLVRK